MKIADKRSGVVNEKVKYSISGIVEKIITILIFSFIFRILAVFQKINNMMNPNIRFNILAESNGSIPILIKGTRSIEYKGLQQPFIAS